MDLLSQNGMSISKSLDLTQNLAVKCQKTFSIVDILPPSGIQDERSTLVLEVEDVCCLRPSYVPSSMLVFV